MKPALRFFIPSLITALLIWVLNHSFEAGGSFTPPLGNLLNPFTGFWQNAEPQQIISSDEWHLPGVTGDVKVVFDERRVPHIFAENLKDAAFVQGYLTARDRLFQMDFGSRATAGRVSEIVGERAISYDLMQRRRGLLFAAENTVKGWKQFPDSYAILEAYSNGVNAWIDRLQPRDYPIEYKIMHFAPERWSTLKTALFVKSMCQSLIFGEDDVEATNALELLGEDVFRFLYPETFWEQEPVIPENVRWDFAGKINHTPPVFPDFGGPVPAPVKPEIERNNGSNNWAVAPSKTKNGHPILAGDPHLPLRLPSIWYEMQLVLPEFNAYGVSIPGIPGIIIGFNEHIAWTQTNAGHDMLDWYTIQWKDATKKEYDLDGVWIKARLQLDTFYIKGREAFRVDTVRYTAWGPVAFESDTSFRKDMAMRWLAHDIPRKDEITMFYNLMKARNYAEFASALSSYIAPAQNYAFACSDGDIALRVQGEFPVKTKGQGRFVQDGSRSSNGWRGWIPESQKPHVRNPSRGFVSSANQPSTSPDYPYCYNSERFEAYRNRILNQQLTDSDSMTVDDMKRLQNFNYGLHAAETLPLMIGLLDTARLSPAEKALLARLKGWNYFYEGNILEPILFEKWFELFYDLVWDEMAGQSATHPVLMPANWRTVFLLRDDPGNRFFDLKNTPEVEKAGTLVAMAFQKMATEMGQSLATNPALTWSAHRQTKISHLARFNAFSRSDIHNGGHRKCLNAMTPTNGPSWRMIVELGDSPKAQVVYPGGQSGNPGSRFYDDFINTWVNGEYFEALYLKKAEDQPNKIVSHINIKGK